jgi:hypothetical protein
MSKIILNNEFKYENDKLYKIHKQSKKWRCCNDLKPRTDGYFVVGINKRLYNLHRVVYLFHNPDWNIHDISKDNEIDHDDKDKSNNKIENLRIIDSSGNNRNQSKKKDCSSIYRGVCWYKTAKKWRARIRIDGKNTHLGYFDDEHEAGAIYQIAYEEIMEKYN